MSDLIGAVQSVLYAVFLGDVFLGDFAIPEHVNFGGKQANTVHRLPGGARVIDVTGPDHDPITFDGIFHGPLADVQAQQLDQLRIAGELVPLAWGLYSFTVLVESVQLKAGYARVDYRVSCIVMPDPGPDEEDDDEALGDGEAPDEPAKAQDVGQAKVTRARAAALPTPPVPPAPPVGVAFIDKGATAAPLPNL